LLSFNEIINAYHTPPRQANTGLILHLPYRVVLPSRDYQALRRAIPTNFDDSQPSKKPQKKYQKTIL
jgi:hypothetical protein